MKNLLRYIPPRYAYTGLLFVVVILCVPIVSFAQADNTGEIFDGVTGFVYNLATGVGGIAVWFGGMLLDLAIQNLVLDMGMHMRGGIGYAVDTLWVVVRDGFNVLFIFGLIYIGFRVILFSEDSKVKTTLGWLIVAALMVNFSLFITKAIVDFSNVAALQIYNASIQTEQVRTSGVFTTTLESVGTTTPAGTYVNRGISAAFMNYFHIQTYASAQIATEDSKQPNLYGGRIMFYSILMMFVMLIAAFVFAAGAFLLISRFVGLIIFMIFSPVMFAGMVFPYLQKYQKMWWGYFLKYAFVAPAYLFMLYLSLFVINGIGIGGGSFAKAFTSKSWEYGTFMIFLNFFVIAGFLVASLLIAQQMGVYGATASMGMLQGAGKKLRGGIQGYIGRNTIGRIAGGLQYANDTLQTTKPGRIFKRGVTVATAGMLDERTRQKLTSAGLNSNFGGSYSRADDKKWGATIGYNPDDGINKASNDRLRDNIKKANIKEGAQNRENNLLLSIDALANTELSAERFEEAVKDLAKTVKDMSSAELAAQKKKLTHESVAMHITDDQIKSMLNEGYISNSEAETIKDARNNAYMHIAHHGTINAQGTNKFSTDDTAPKNAVDYSSDPKTQAEHESYMREVLARRGTKVAGEFDVNVYKQEKMYEVLTPSMIEERLRNGGVSKSDLKDMLEAFKKFHYEEITPGMQGYKGVSDNSPWGKWKNSNSTFAAQFFTADDET